MQDKFPRCPKCEHPYSGPASTIAIRTESISFPAGDPQAGKSRSVDLVHCRSCGYVLAALESRL